MELTQTPYGRIVPQLPMQRGHVSPANRQVLNAILDVAEHGCKWRGLPARLGAWRTIHARMNRWPQNEVLARVFEHLQRERIVRSKLEALALDGALAKMHPSGAGALPKMPPPSGGRSRGGWTTKMPKVAAEARTARMFSLLLSRAHDASEERKLLNRLGRRHDSPALITAAQTQATRPGNWPWCGGTS